MGCRDDRKMANGFGKHKLLVMGPTEPWSVREKLCLATSVMKSGDQNWVSVSRAIKPFAEPGRPPDWFSQKHCASKYSELLETTEAPKRKRGEKGEVVETVEDVIVRRLTAERIDELKKLIKETQEKHRKLKREAELIQAGHLDSKLEELWEEIHQKKKIEEEEAEQRRKNTDAAYQGISFTLKWYLGGKHQYRLMTFAESSGNGNDDISHGSLLDDPTQKKLLGQKATPPPSPLLSELLKKGSILASNSRLSKKKKKILLSLILQTDEAAEVLDAAAVEAALSLCEENGHALAGAWEAGPFQPHESHPTVPLGVPQPSLHCSLEVKTEVLEVQDGTDDRLNVGGGENASGTKMDNEINGPQVCGEEDGDGVEGFLSEPDGEIELEPAASESEDGYSLHTASSSLQLHTTADSIPSSPASSQFSVCSEDLEALQAHKIWKKAIMLVWRAAANHRYANVFLQPVTDEIAPGYHSIVHRPMDLATIKKNIETGLIRTTAEFQRDIMLMFQNAVMYNSLDHDVYHMALEMQRDVLEQIQQFLATQLIMETSESGISAKSLRGRENTRKQDSTDKDTVSMSSPAFLLSLFDGGTRGRRCAIEADLKMKK
uniref:Bromodomain-containing protein 8 n=1 Tax=Anabas testudineus TaxID=64144 RepID=A0A7N6AUP9_ANATE